jgi:2,6-dihydroxypyridine 3-monooxygenase
MVGFDQGEGSVTVRFADRDAYTCDLLVCADGIDSTARQLLLPDVVPRYAGSVAWRGTFPEHDLSVHTFQVLRDAITYQVLEHSHILVYPIPNLDGAVQPGRRLMNFVWYRNVADGGPLAALMLDREGRQRLVSLPPGSVQQRFVEELRAFAAAEMAPPIAEVVRETVEPFVQVIFDAAVPAMAFGRVCLIGDAAIVLRPHAAAGTAKAARDAWALAEALTAADGNVDEALDRWEPGQLALGRQVMARARDIGTDSQVAGSWVPGDPKLAFGLYGPGR